MEFEATGSYRMGENDTMIQAKEKAKEIAVRDIMGKAGFFIMSNTIVKNSKLVDDEISVKTANLLQMFFMPMSLRRLTTKFLPQNLSKKCLKGKVIRPTQKIKITKKMSMNGTFSGR